jgi:hypothetical protein
LAGIQNCRFSSFLPRLYSTVFLYSAGVITAELHRYVLVCSVILICEQNFFFFPIMQNVEFTSPSAVILSLSSGDDLEVDKLDVADICVLKKQLKRPFFDGLSYEELRASLSLPPV